MERTWRWEQTVKQVRCIVCQMMISAEKSKAGWAGVVVQIGCGDRRIFVLKSLKDDLIEKVTFEQALKELRTED